jgi:group II intron reverse transcriptase/maturase
MNGPGKSDKPVVPQKPANASTDLSFWELFERVQRVEGRGLAEGNGEGVPDALVPDALPPAGPAKQVDRTQSRVGSGGPPQGAVHPEDLHRALDRVRRAAHRDKGLRFTSLWHHVYHVDRLRDAYLALKRDAAAGVDGQTWQAYGQELEDNLRGLSDRLARGAYRAKPVKRVYIPKADGRQRPIGIPALEDKIVQRAAVQVLNAVYEADFLGFSYGFRPGRSAHMALDALAVGIQTRKVNWVLDADIRGFFDTLDHGWLMEFVGHRIADPRVLRHVRKWLGAGVMERGERVEQEEGTPQGGSISPLLANVYLHYVFDLWAEQWRRTRAQGDVVVVRYADDFVVGFQHESDARRFLDELRERFRRFNLELHAEKTRVIEFGCYAAERRGRRGQGKPETFNFLGFTHICDETRRGRFIVLRQTIARRMRAKLAGLKQALRRCMHLPVGVVGRWLGQVLLGHYRYYGVPRNYPALDLFRDRVRRLWRRVMNLRGQKGWVSETKMTRIAACWLPDPWICQPYPEGRLAVITRGKSPVR